MTVSPAGHESLILISKVMGAVALRLVVDPELRQRAKTEQAAWLKKYNVGVDTPSAGFGINIQADVFFQMHRYRSS
jgi:hypothetical protein